MAGAYFDDGDRGALPQAVKKTLSQTAANVRSVDVVARISETVT